MTSRGVNIYHLSYPLKQQNPSRQLGSWGFYCQALRLEGALPIAASALETSGIISPPALLHVRGSLHLTVCTCWVPAPDRLHPEGRIRWRSPQGRGHRRRVGAGLAEILLAPWGLGTGLLLFLLLDTTFTSRWHLIGFFKAPVRKSAGPLGAQAWDVGCGNYSRQEIKIRAREGWDFIRSHIVWLEIKLKNQFKQNKKACL